MPRIWLPARFKPPLLCSNFLYLVFKHFEDFVSRPLFFPPFVSFFPVLFGDGGLYGFPSISCFFHVSLLCLDVHVHIASTCEVAGLLRPIPAQAHLPAARDEGQDEVSRLLWSQGEERLTAELSFEGEESGRRAGGRLRARVARLDDCGCRRMN